MELSPPPESISSGESAACAFVRRQILPYVLAGPLDRYPPFVLPPPPPSVTGVVPASDDDPPPELLLPPPPMDPIIVTH